MGAVFWYHKNMKDFDGFSPAVEIKPYVWKVDGPDNYDHFTFCAFVDAKGLLPCSCTPDHATSTIWHNQYLTWARERVITDPLEMPIEWSTGDPIGIGGHGPEE